MVLGGVGGEGGPPQTGMQLGFSRVRSSRVWNALLYPREVILREECLINPREVIPRVECKS